MQCLKEPSQGQGDTFPFICVFSLALKLLFCLKIHPPEELFSKAHDILHIHPFLTHSFIPQIFIEFGFYTKGTGHAQINLTKSLSWEKLWCKAIGATGDRRQERECPRKVSLLYMLSCQERVFKAPDITLTALYTISTVCPF